jgi:uncharacterized damage-inducible protein DinB
MTRHRVGSEEQILSEFLNQQLDAIVWKLDGLTDDQLRQPITASGMCLLALAKHVAAAECYWLCEIFGRPLGPWRLSASDDVELDPGDTTEGVLAFCAQARAACDQAISELDLDATAVTWLGDTVSFRWAILHMIEEAARHAGHADLIRERIDNTTGHLPPANLPY